MGEREQDILYHFDEDIKYVHFTWEFKLVKLKNAFSDLSYFKKVDIDIFFLAPPTT